MRNPAPLVPALDPAAAARLEQGHPGIAGLERAAGGPWMVDFDVATGRLRRAFGTGIPLLPGSASGIPARELSAAELERIGREFLATNSSLFGIDPSEWALAAAASRPLDDGRVQPIQFDRVVAGVPVEPAQLQLVANRGNLVYVNAVGLEAIDVTASPSLGEDETWAVVLREAALIGAALQEARMVGKPSLALVRVQDEPRGAVRFRLLRRHSFRLGEELETWQAGVDAHSGELVEFFDANRYVCSLESTNLQGQVRGGIKPAQATDPEEVRNFPYTLVIDNAVNDRTDSNGYFFYSGKTVTSGLQGSFFRVNCTSCTNPVQPTLSNNTTGILDFGTGGSNATGNGTSTPADRTAFYHENVARSIAAKWISPSWIQSNVGVNVNINQTCNAFWNGSTLNFFRAGGACRNTGEIRDVMQHEWGHGMDSNDGRTPRDSAMGEAYGDMIALFVDHDSCIGQSFWSTSSGPYCLTIPDCSGTAACTGVRNIDEKRSTSGLMTMTTALSNCPSSTSCFGPLGRQCHCEGQIFGQLSFHLANNLLTGDDYDTGNPLPGTNPAFSEVAAWFIHERLFFNATAIFSSYAPSTRQSVGTGTYDAYMTLDDDNGNLADGTPNAEYINNAFVHHEVNEPTLIADAANCTPPGDPVYTLTPLLDSTTGFPQVKISWPDQNAQFYAIYKNYKKSDVWLPVRNQVLDDNRPVYDIYDEPIDVGVTYNYVVIAVSANGCPSPGANVQTEVVALPDVSLIIGQVQDPAPGGDGDGVPEPGELVRLRLDLRELAGLVGLTNASVSISTTDPLATVVQGGPMAYGNVAPSATVNGPSQFEIGISTSHGCGTVVPLVAAVSSDSACMLRGLGVLIPSTGCTPAARAEAVATRIAVTADNGNTCSDGDLVIDNGELATVDVTVSNPGTLTASNVTVQLSSSNPKLAILSTNPVTIASLPNGNTATASFQVQATGATCQEPAGLTAVVNSNENLFPVSTSDTLSLEEDRPVASFGTGFEADFGVWTASQFTRTTFRKNGGAYAAFAGPTPQPHACDSSGDGAGGCATLTSPRFVCGPTCQFRLANWYQLEPLSGGQYWDRANVHVIDAAGNHVLLTPAAGKNYNGSNGDSTALCHVDNENAWAGNAAAGATWGNSTFDLSAWSGREIQLEINYNADDLGICEGFYIDDLSISDARQRTCDVQNCSASAPDVGVASCGLADLCAASTQSNGVADPGEDITYTVELRNTGTADALDVRGDLLVQGGGTVVSGGTIGGSPQLDILAGGSYQHIAVVRVTGTCGTSLDIDVTNLRAGTSTFPAALVACDRSIGANQTAQTLPLADAVGGMPIPETNQPPFLDRPLDNPVPVAVTRATLAITVSHARLADVHAWMTGPRGGQVVADPALNGTLDVTGFVNTEGNGTYTLSVVDNKRGTAGTLDRWSLTLDVPAYSSCTTCSGGCSAPNVAVEASSLSVCTGGLLAFQTTFLAPGSGLFDYEWDFGDGSPVQVVSDPNATVVHAFAGLGPVYTVSFRARSKSSGTCDASASVNVSIDPGTRPTGGPIGNRLLGSRVARGASFEWRASGVSPARFALRKAVDKRQLDDTLTGIGDEPVVGRTSLEWALDPGALATGPSLAFYEVNPEDSCGAIVFP